MAGTLEHVLDARRAQQEGSVELACVDTRDRLVEIRGVAEALVPDEPVDELDVELSGLADDGEVMPLWYPTAWAWSYGSDARCARAVAGAVESPTPIGGSASSWPRKRRWVGKISRPASDVETSTTIIRALSGVPSSSA